MQTHSQPPNHSTTLPSFGRGYLVARCHMTNRYIGCEHTGACSTNSVHSKHITVGEQPHAPAQGG